MGMAGGGVKDVVSPGELCGFVRGLVALVQISKDSRSMKMQSKELIIDLGGYTFIAARNSL